MIKPYKIKSWLFVPAIREDFFEKLIQLEGKNKPDAIIFDLEDSVAKEYKKDARKKLSRLLKTSVLSKNIKDKFITCIRVNNIHTHFFNADVDTVRDISPNFIIFPKVQNSKEIPIYRKIAKKSQLFIAIESLQGINSLDSILKKLTGTDCFALGYEDLSAQLQIERPSDLNSVNMLTHLILNGLVKSREFGIPIIDAVSRKYSKKDTALFRRECKFMSDIGFFSKVCIHPNQVSPTNKIFEKKIIEIRKRAKQVLGNFKELKNGTAVITPNNEMLDTPSYKLY